jgi:hypothetical protein
VHKQQAFGIWPDNVHPFNVYTRLTTQWRVGGMGGYLGLDYATLPFFLDLEAVPKADWPEVVTCIQMMEGEALRLLRVKAEA